MIVVVYPSGKARVVDTDDYELVSSLYNSFVEDASVCASLYPKPFLRTLPFDNGVCETTTAALWRLFLSWCYVNAKKHALELWASALSAAKKAKATPEATPEVATEAATEVAAEAAAETAFVAPEPEFQPYGLNSNGATVFKKRPLLCYELAKEVEEKEAKSHKDNVHETCTAAVYFYNSTTRKSGLAFFDKNASCDERAYLAKMADVGINDVDVRWVFNLPQTELSYTLAEHYGIESMEPKEQVEALARIVRTLNLHKEKNVFVKAVLEFLYNNYTFEWGSSVAVKTMYDDFCTYNNKRCRFPLTALVGENAFSGMLTYLFLELSKNSVINLRKRVEEKSVSLEIDSKLASLLKTPHVTQKTHQLRGEPPCNASYVGPWGMSSQAEFGASEEGLLSKKLE